MSSTTVTIAELVTRLRRDFLAKDKGMSPLNVRTLPVLPSILFLGSEYARRRVSSAAPGHSAGIVWLRRRSYAAGPASGGDVQSDKRN